MCGRYAVTTDPAGLAAELDANNLHAINEVAPAGDDVAADRPGVSYPGVSYNVAPTETVMTLVERHDREHPDLDPTLRIRAMRWGLIPPWTKGSIADGPGKGPLLFNARAETAATKSAFRAAVARKRCLVPMDGWYEWMPGAAVAGAKPAKIPFYMSPSDGTRLFMAGLWSVWRPSDLPPQAPPVMSMTILTTEAVGDLREVHDRMPLIMPYDNWSAWLDPDHPAPATLLAPVSREVAAAISIREVSPLVNRVSNNGPELLAPVTDSARGQRPEQETLL